MSTVARNSQRAVATVAFLGGVLLLAALPAQAAPPQAQPDVQSLPGTAGAGGAGYCPFDVVVTYVTNQVAGDPVANADGSISQHFSGYAAATVTNVPANKSLTYQISGPGTLTTGLPGGSWSLDAQGANLLWTTVDNSYPGVPQLAYSTGHVQVRVASSGLTTSYRLDGRRVDVCAALS